MFLRTERLTLRPGWIEDAPALAAAMGHEAVVRNLARAPWPYALADAREWLMSPRGHATPNFLIYAHDEGSVRLIGGIGIGPLHDEPHELGYWITPDAWGRGYATEAVRGVLATARDTLRITRVAAGHMVDNPASGVVLRKAGFRPTGRVQPMRSLGRGATVPCARYTLDLKREDDPCPEGPLDDARMLCLAA